MTDTKPKWTPGPWISAFSQDGNFLTICPDKEHYLARHRSREERRANSILAAAAPEMAEFINRVAYGPIGEMTASADEILWTLTQEARALLARING